MNLRCCILLTFLVFLTVPPVDAQLELEPAFPNLTFRRPVDLQDPRDGTDRLFVVQQAGIISVVDYSGAEPVSKVFLDIRDRVDDVGNEEGLLGLAFHPNYKTNGYFYVNYTASNPDRTVIARYRVKPDNRDEADKNSELVLLEFAQPYVNHNGGQTSFGPDGYLYIATGDGGAGGDPHGNGQSLKTLLGKILRIDVDHPSGGKKYGIPGDNPFAGNTDGYREEIYAYGLRNPWRFSFDPVTGWFWVADVGQDRIEEIDVVEKGKNYGWNIMEGNSCFRPSTGCDTTGLVKPVWEYRHNVGQSITGGFVYRGSRVPELVGAYIYADYVSGRLWSIRYDGTNLPTNTELLDTSLNIASFGVDRNSELYICAFDGKIYRFKTTAPPIVTSIDVYKEGVPMTYTLHQNVPNPFNASTVVRFDLPVKGRVKLEVYNSLGKRVALLVDEDLSPGYHQRAWQAEGLASGTYMYRLEMGGFVETRKLVLIR